jgi:hypothetical protein
MAPWDAHVAELQAAESSPSSTFIVPRFDSRVRLYIDDEADVDVQPSPTSSSSSLNLQL